MTFVPYPNISATSDSGEFRVEIVGQRTDDFFRDQANFTYRSFQSDRLVWEWKPGNGKQAPQFLDDYPHEAWISNDGWVVVRTHEWFHAGLLVLSPRGEVVLRKIHRSLLDDGESGFLDSEPEKFMGDSSAGPFWSRSSIAYFSELRGRLCWTIRTWWGRRVVIDLLVGKILDPGTEDTDVAASREHAWVEKSLADGVRRIEAEGPNRPEENEHFWSSVGPLLTAAFHAGWLKSAAYVPLLRRLEEVDLVGSTGYGPIPWAAVDTLPFRQVAKLSLLRLGHEPKWLSHYRFKVHSKRDTPNAEALFAFPMQPATRDHSILVAGMDQKDVLRRIGAPDYIRNQWEYDYLLDGKEMTVCVSWDESHLPKYPTGEANREVLTRFYDEYRAAVDANPPRISGVEFAAPQWREITMRDHEVVV